MQGHCGDNAPTSQPFDLQTTPPADGSPSAAFPPQAAGAGKLGLSFDGEKLDLAATVGEMAKKFDLEDDDMLDVLL